MEDYHSRWHSEYISPRSFWLVREIRNTVARCLDTSNDPVTEDDLGMNKVL
jgi:hypothetical protein